MSLKPTSAPRSYVQPLIVGVLLSAGGVALAAQVAVGLTQQPIPSMSHAVALVTQATPTPAPSVVPSTKPSAAPTQPIVTPKPTAAPRKVVAVVPKTLPAVTPAPHSPVSHLVPAGPAATPLPTPTPTPAGGLGQGATPTPAPSPTATPTLPSFYYTSSNWSGYMSPAGHFTGVSGSWTVPHVSGTSSHTTADAAWVGIGGVTSQDLIQVGTDDTVTPDGNVTVMAFYEMLPDAETPIPMLVRQGDAMSADIHVLTGNQWLITINNDTRGTTFSITVSYDSTESSAEWIQEDPSYASGGLVPFDTFGSIAFTNAQATSGGSTQTAAAAGAQAIMMLDSGGHAIATPSLLDSDGQSFTVTGI